MNFFWVIRGELAGSERPTHKYDLELLIAQGIKTIVSLTEDPLDLDLVESFNINTHHFPIKDLTAPNLIQINSFIKLVKKELENNKSVLVHCLGGVGRTGTMLACYLVNLGYMPKDAIRRVRQIQPGSIHLRSQVLSILEFGQRIELKSD